MLATFLDNGLRGFGEHNYTLLSRVSDALKAKNVDVRIFCFRGANPAAMAALAAKPHFHDYFYYAWPAPWLERCRRAIRGAWSEFSRSPLPSESETAARANAGYHKDLCALPDETWRDGNLVVIPAISQNQIVGLTDFFRSRPDIRATIICQLMMSIDWTSWGRKSVLGSELYAGAFEHLAALDHRLFFTAENESMAATFRDQFGISVQLLPVPLAVQRKQKAPGARARFGYFGYAKGEKGFPLIPEAIRRCRTRNVPVDFTVQINHGRWEPETVEAERQLRQLPDLDLIEGEMRSDDYLAAADRVDACLLPYDPERFGQRGSGILTEAIAAGRPVVAAAGIGAATLIEKGEAAGEIFAPYDAAALADAISRLVGRLDAAKAQAALLAEAHTRKHDGHAYAQIVLDLMRSPRSSRRKASAGATG